jgi:hypothetical protein
MVWLIHLTCPKESYNIKNMESQVSKLINEKDEYDSYESWVDAIIDLAYELEKRVYKQEKA